MPELCYTSRMHYSFAQNALTMHEWSRPTARRIASIARSLNKTPVLCYAGMSGVAMATALELALVQLPKPIVTQMAYVRKRGEKSHGHPIEKSTVADALFDTDTHFYIYVDDFVTHGGTFAWVDKRLKGRITHICVSSYGCLTTLETCYRKMYKTKATGERKFELIYERPRDDNLLRSKLGLDDTN